MKLYLLLALVLIAACTATPLTETQAAQEHETIVAIQEEKMKFTIEKVTLTTSDEKHLAGTLYNGGEKSIILLHQLNLDRSSWDSFAKELQQEGWTLLAIDLRGHGESDGDWKAFSDQSFIAMLEDVKAAASFLSERGKRVSAIMGASIGANTAFRYSSQKRLPAILLSPGIEYHGININDITSSAPTLIIVAEGDAYSYTSSQELNENNLLGKKELLVLPRAEHGTYLLEKPGVKEAILSFLSNLLN